MTSALAYYGAALRSASNGGPAHLRLVDPFGLRPPMQRSAHEWCAIQPGDTGLLARCHGSTLDVGCGPGRLAAALVDRQVPVLGIDISSEAVRQTRRRGVPAELACVLASDLGDRRWQHVLLIDGNIGIGGDPGGLLRRCGELTETGGNLLIELDPPGKTSWAGTVSLGYRDGLSTPFAWAGVTIDDLSALAASVSMLVEESWTEAGRWFARLAPMR